MYIRTGLIRRQLLVSFYGARVSMLLQEERAEERGDCYFMEEEWVLVVERIGL